MQTAYDNNKSLSLHFSTQNFKSKLGCIATQMPFPHTQEDLWRLLYDRASKTIVMLNEIDQNDEVTFEVFMILS